MRLASTAALCACIAFTTSSSLGQADPKREEAIKRYQEGIALYDRGQNEAAYARFAEAYAVVQTPSILFNLARTEQLTGRSVDAAKHFREYLGLPAHPKITADLRKQATAFLAQLHGQLGHVDIDAPPGTILSIDDKVVAANGPLDVTPGTHTVLGKLGPVSRSVTVTCVAGQTVLATVVFDTAGPAPTVATPGPPAASPLAPTTAQESASPPVSMPSSDAHVSSTGAAVRWGLTGVAAVALGFGIGFDAESHAKESDASSYLASHPGACANAASTSCVGFNQILSDENGARNLSYGFLSVGIATAVGAAAAWIFWPKETQSGHGWVVPAAGPRSVGVYAGQSF